MLSSNKNKSIVSILRDRELNIKPAPYISSLKIASQLIRSDRKSLYSNTFIVRSPVCPIIYYDYGNLYLSNLTEYCSINVSYKKPSPFKKMEQSKKRKGIIYDVIFYSGISACRSSERKCQCETQRCICFSQCLLSISVDSWFCQHSAASGKLMEEIYVKRNGRNAQFENFELNWDIYGERFVLQSQSCYDSVLNESSVVLNLAVFTTFPIEFYVMFEIKRSVFGQDVSIVSLSKQSLIICLYSSVTIYSFDDFLNGGTLTPYKLGEPYGSKGKVGTYPTGLPMNFTYSAAPPVLFKVKCMPQIIRFGGYPYHCFIRHPPSKHSRFSLTSVATDAVIDTSTTLEPGNDGGLDTVMFHPDNSNRIILSKEHSIDVYKIHTENDSTSLVKLFSMGLLSNSSDNQVRRSSRTTIKPREPVCNSTPSYILCHDYNDELKIFAVVAEYLFNKNIIILLYDSVTGEELRRITLKKTFYNSVISQIFFDLHAIIVIEGEYSVRCAAHVFIM